MTNLLSITGAFAATLWLLLARPTESSFTTRGRRRRRSSSAGCSVVWLTARPLSTQNKIQVSQADIPRDLDAIRQCRAAAFDDADNKPMLESQRNFLNATSVAAGRAICFVARRDDRWSTFFSSAGPARPVLGTADVKFRNNKACCFINNVLVAPQARGRGVGKRLIRAVEEAALEKNMETAALEVCTSNTAAVALYRSCGYRPAGVPHAALARLGEWTHLGFQIQMAKDLSSSAAAR